MYAVHLRLRMMLQARINHTVFVARQRYPRGVSSMVSKWSLHHHQVGYSRLVRQKQLRKALLLVFTCG